jgi:methyltransferase
MHTLFLFSCAAEVLLFERPFVVWLGYPALAACLLAQALRYWAITTLKGRWNVRIIVLPSAPPVTSGPYRFIRHPNYVAVILEVLFLPLIHSCYLTAIAFSIANAAVLAVRIRAEEEALGELYAAELGRRPRFLPGTKADPINR